MAFASVMNTNIRAVVLTLSLQGQVDTITFHPIDNDGNVTITTTYAPKVLLSQWPRPLEHSHIVFLSCSSRVCLRRLLL